MAPRRVRLGDGELPLDATGGRGTMGWMRDSTALYPGVGAGGVTYQPSTEAQRSVALERLNEDGYLLLRGLLSPAAVRAGLRRFTAELAERGVRFADADRLQLADGSLGADFPGMGDLQPMAHAEELSRVLEGPELHNFFHWLFSEPAGTLDHKWTRVVPPQLDGRPGGVLHMGAQSRASPHNRHRSLLTVWPFQTTSTWGGARTGSTRCGCRGRTCRWRLGGSACCRARAPCPASSASVKPVSPAAAPLSLSACRLPPLVPTSLDPPGVWRP